MRVVTTVWRVLGRLLHATAGTALLGGLLAGTPWFLVTYTPNPLPDHLPGWAELGEWLVRGYDVQFFWDVLTVGIWVFWARFAVLLCVELGRTVHDLIRYREPRHVARTGLQAVAAFVVTALIGSILFDLARGLAARTAAPTAAQQPAPLAAMVVAGPAGHTPTTGTGSPAPNGLAKPARVAGDLDLAMATPAAFHRAAPTTVPAALHTVGTQPSWVTAARDAGHGIHRVRAGDNLWTVATNKLGDGQRWRQIYVATRGKPQPDGHRLTDPDLVNVGWYLILPDASAGKSPPPVKPPRTTAPTTADATTPPPHSPTVASTVAPPAHDGIETPTSPTPAPVRPGHDGVITGPPQAGTDAPTRQPGAAGHDGAQQPTGPRTSPVGIDLPGTGWIDVGLAAALAAAGALVWAHRTRRYRPGNGHGVHRADPDLRPLPAVIGHLRSRLTNPLAPDEVVAEPTEQWIAQLQNPTIHPTANTGPPTAEPPTDAPADSQSEPEPAGPRRVDPGDAEPVAPAISGARADLWPTSGLGLTGPGAHAAARGMLVAALACGQPGVPHSRTRVIVPAGTLASLLGTGAVRVPQSTRLEVTAGLEEALAEVEAQALYRARLCQEQDVFSIGELRDQHPDTDDLPPLLLITDVGTATEQTRVAWSLSHHHRLDIHGVLLGGWTHGDTVHVDADGATSPLRRQAGAERHRHGHCADLGRLAVLDEEQTVQMLATLAEANTGEPAPDPHVEAPAPAAPAAPAAGTSSTDDEHANTIVEDPRPTAGAAEEPSGIGPSPPPAGNGHLATASDADVADADATEDSEDHDAVATAEDDGAGGRPADTAGDGRIRVVLLGRPGLPDYHGKSSKPGGRARALELLAYLAVHGGHATTDAVMEDLVPDSTVAHGKQKLSAAIYSLRQAIRDCGGDSSDIDRDERHFALRKDRFDIDLWRLRDGLARAKTAPTGVQRVRLLRHALAAYGGTFAEGQDNWEWVDLPREAVRRDYIDTVLALAQELATDPREALTVLEPAIAANPHTEILYQQAMRAHAALGDEAGIKRVRRQLTRALEDIDAEPEDDTRALAVSLLADLARRAGRPARGERR